MTDIDRLLTDAGARWRANQLPPPVVDAAIFDRGRDVPQRRFLPNAVAAAMALALLLALAAVLVYRGSQVGSPVTFEQGGPFAQPERGYTVRVELSESGDGRTGFAMQLQNPAGTDVRLLTVQPLALQNLELQSVQIEYGRFGGDDCDNWSGPTRVVDAAGAVLPARRGCADDVALLVALRYTVPGPSVGTFNGLLVRYEADGRAYETVLPMGFESIWIPES